MKDRPCPACSAIDPDMTDPSNGESVHAWRDNLIRRAQVSGPPVLTAVCHPCDGPAMSAAARAKALGLITPILVGPEAKLRKTADDVGVDLSSFQLEFTPHSHASASRAVALIRSSEAAILMKGSLHTDEFMAAVVDTVSGLRTDRRVSQVYVTHLSTYPRQLMITDAAINIAPTLMEKRDIVQNAIDLAHSLGLERPKVAILSAIETVNPKLQSTLDAAALCKMSDRGQISGADLDGPLAFDNAINPEAAAEKGISSRVAGQADILVAPDLVAGNILAKLLIYLAGADAAGLVLGARAPVILTSRADSEATRITSCALAVLASRAQGIGRLS